MKSVLLLGLAVVSVSVTGKTLYECEDRYGNLFHTVSSLSQTDDEIRFTLYSLTGIKEDHPKFSLAHNPVVRLEATADARKFANRCEARNGLFHCRVNPTRVVLTYKDGAVETLSTWNSWFALHKLTKTTHTGTQTHTLVSEFYVGLDRGSIHPNIRFRPHRCTLTP